MECGKHLVDSHSVWNQSVEKVGSAVPLTKWLSSSDDNLHNAQTFRATHLLELLVCEQVQHFRGGFFLLFFFLLLINMPQS